MSNGTSFEEKRELTSPHQRCDAKQPCTACVNGDKSAECIYESRRRPRPIPTTQVPTGGFSWPPIGPPTLLLTWSNFSEPTPPLVPSLTPCEQPPPLTLLPWELSPRLYNQIGLGPLSDVLAVQNTHGQVEHAPHPAGSSFTILPSIHFQTIPRPLRVPLSLVPPEYMQVSSIAKSELAMTLCMFLDPLISSGHEY